LTLTRIGLGNFRTIPVPVPPAAEQARIVTRVAHLRSLCNDLRQRLAAASERQSQLAQSFVEMQSTTTV
jgi:type I restriction enzyme S subunit